MAWCRLNTVTVGSLVRSENESTVVEVAVRMTSWFSAEPISAPQVWPDLPSTCTSGWVLAARTGENQVPRAGSRSARTCAPAPRGLSGATAARRPSASSRSWRSRRTSPRARARKARSAPRSCTRAGRTSSRAQGIPLASVAPSVWHAATGNAAARDAEPVGVVPEELALSRAAQQEKSTWTRADLVNYLCHVLPRSGRDPARAAGLLEETADGILRPESGPVLCLEAPEPAEVPRALLHADGRGVHRRHGGVPYATRAQLSMEERLVAQAAAQDPSRL